MRDSSGIELPNMLICRRHTNVKKIVSRNLALLTCQTALASGKQVFFDKNSYIATIVAKDNTSSTVIFQRD